MFSGIEKSLFDSIDFKEDSVRELIIAPILTKLGFGPSGSTRVVRSKSLQNPFIRIGTRKHPITIIPDYTLYVNDKPHLILDAKAPHENVLDPRHVQQAYSYAIHMDIRCREFALCNGRELVVFDTASPVPLIHVRFEDFESRWEEIEKCLGPRYLAAPSLRKFAPDFGMSLVRMGFQKDTDLVMLDTRLNLFARVDDQLITATANCDMGYGEHCVSYDFHPRMLPLIVAGLPSELAAQFCNAIGRAPHMAAAGLAIEIDVTARLGDVVEVDTESFVPLIIQEVHAARFNPAEVANDPNDVPDHVFKLRKAFKIVG